MGAPRKKRSSSELALGPSKRLRKKHVTVEDGRPPVDMGLSWGGFFDDLRPYVVQGLVTTVQTLGPIVLRYGATALADFFAVEAETAAVEGVVAVAAI